MGTTFVKWMGLWEGAAQRFQNRTFRIQSGRPAFAGYVTAHFNVYRDGQTKAFSKWNSQIQPRIKEDIVDKMTAVSPNLVIQLNNGSYHMGDIKNYHSLIPLSQSALKPIFELTSKDGAIGAHLKAAKECGELYDKIASKVINKL